MVISTVERLRNFKHQTLNTVPFKSKLTLNSQSSRELRISLVSSIQSLGRITNIHVTIYAVLCYSLGLNVKLSGNQSWVNLLFSVLRDSILDSW